jgi:indole-3-glycerol phosphate synthase
MTILGRIVAAKRREIAGLDRREIEARLRSAPQPFGFRRALELAPRPVALIAEIKRASPSEGVIRPEFDPEALAAAYAEAGAHAISVLTDREHFQGDPAHLPRAKAASGLPALFKDFVIAPVQVLEARSLGADAILLIVATLPPADLRALRELAEELGMDALVEAHTDAEARAAVDSGATLVGVNNRDLATFETRLETAERILPALPQGVLGVAESALQGPEDVVRMGRAGARAVLIGTAFCRAVDPAAKVRQVMGW